MTHLALQYPLDTTQSERVLGFCLNIGVDCFSMNFAYGNKDELQRIRTIEEELMPFKLGERLLEQTVWRNDDRFVQTDCWSLNSETVRLILNACDGSLSHYGMGRLPEDWTFYRQSELILGFVSHEQYAFIRLSDDDVEKFKGLGIGYTVA
jgi:hypothetical protein